MITSLLDKGNLNQHAFGKSRLMYTMHHGKTYPCTLILDQPVPQRMFSSWLGSDSFSFSLSTLKSLGACSDLESRCMDMFFHDARYLLKSYNSNRHIAYLNIVSTKRYFLRLKLLIQSPVTFIPFII